MGNRSRYKGRSAHRASGCVPHTFGEIRPLMSKWVLPVYDDPAAPPHEIVCDTRESRAHVQGADDRDGQARIRAAMNPAVGSYDGLPSAWLRSIRTWAEANALIDKVYVYGSRLKGLQHADSDLDLAVVLVNPDDPETFAD